MQAQNGATALHNAAGGGFETVVKAFLAANADIDVQNTNCNTALHLAAGKGDPCKRPCYPPCNLVGSPAIIFYPHLGHVPLWRHHSGAVSKLREAWGGWQRCLIFMSPAQTAGLHGECGSCVACLWQGTWRW